MKSHNAIMIELKRAIQELPVMDEPTALEILDAMRYRLPKVDRLEAILTSCAGRIDDLIGLLNSESQPLPQDKHRRN